MPLLLFTLARLMFDTNFRMIYPFMSTFQNGLGVSLTSLSLLLTVRAMMGFLGPLFAPLADSQGRRISMLLGIGGFTIGALLIVLWPVFPVFFVSALLMMTSALIYVPAMQALLSDQVAFERRGRVIGFTELSWSLAFFIGVPLVGWLISTTGRWYSPYFFFLALGAVYFLVFRRLIPSDREHQRRQRENGVRFDLRSAVRSPGLLIGLAMAFTMAAGNEAINVVFGLWLEDSFQMQLTALGAASFLIGAGELGGASLSTWLVDRLGKQRAVLGGMLLNSLSIVALVLLGGSPAGALIGLFLFYMTYEFSLVSTIPLMSEAVPGLRATAIAATLSSFSIGRAVNSTIGPLLYTHWGFPANAALNVLLNLVAIALLSRLKIGLKQPDESIQPA
jgi:predicted MFS family arabinose efflux permease